MRSKVSFVAVALVVTAGLAGVAVATTIQTNTLAAWETGLTAGSQAEADFSVIGLKSYNTASGITLSVPNYGPFGITGPDNSGYNLTGITYKSLTALDGAADGQGNVSMAMPTGGENAILLGIGSTGSAPITVTLSDAETFTLTPGQNGQSFLGLSLSHYVTAITLSTTNGSRAVLDDLWAGHSNLPQDSVAPEKSTLLMVGTGLAFFGAGRKLFSKSGPKS
jgi:archaellum component FlaG (FlaF/FlaG flagellin family)